MSLDLGGGGIKEDVFETWVNRDVKVLPFVLLALH